MINDNYNTSKKFKIFLKINLKWPYGLLSSNQKVAMLFKLYLTDAILKKTFV